jgi:hypothetical protein
VAYIRRLPSGKWQATIYLPDGKRRTYTSTLKGEAREWGAIHEARIRRGEWVEPRSTRVFYEDWRARWWDSRVIEDETRRSDAGTLSKWVDPVWSGRLLPSISRMEVQSWVHDEPAGASVERGELAGGVGGGARAGGCAVPGAAYVSAYGGVVVGAGGGAVVRRAAVAGARVLRHDRALRAPGRGRAPAGGGCVGADRWAIGFVSSCLLTPHGV